MDLLSHFPRDPRILDLDERRRWQRTMASAQRRWLDRLRRLCETPPAADFPAFLLDTEAMAPLAERLGTSDRRSDLPVDVADELDWFADAYRDYLRTCDGEDSLDSRRAG